MQGDVFFTWDIQTYIHTYIQTDGHRNLYTESAQRADSVKMEIGTRDSPSLLSLDYISHVNSIKREYSHLIVRIGRQVSCITLQAASIMQKLYLDDNPSTVSQARAKTSAHSDLVLTNQAGKHRDPGQELQ